MNNSLITQIKVMLQNVQNVLDVIPEDQLFDKNISEWTLGQQIYHIVYSTEKWFLVQNDHYRNRLDYDPLCKTSDIDPTLNKEELNEIFSKIKTEVIFFVESISIENDFAEQSSIDFMISLFFGQIRHTMYHVGLIHGQLQVLGLEAPEYVKA